MKKFFTTLAALVLLFSPLFAGASTNTNSGLFDGSSYPTANNVNGTNGQSITSQTFSYAAWVKFANLTDPTASVARIVQISDGSNNFQIAINSGLSATIITRHTQSDTGSASAAHEWGSTPPSTGVWYHVGVVVNGSGVVTHVCWAAATDSTHTDLTDNGSFNVQGSGTIGTNKIYEGSRADAEGQLSGKLDDARLYNSAKTCAGFDADWKQELVGNESGLVAYYKHNNDWNDSQTNTTTHNLTAVGASTFSTDVPFTGATASTPTFGKLILSGDW